MFDILFRWCFSFEKNRTKTYQSQHSIRQRRPNSRFHTFSEFIFFQKPVFANFFVGLLQTIIDLIQLFSQQSEQQLNILTIILNIVLTIMSSLFLFKLSNKIKNNFPPSEPNQSYFRHIPSFPSHPPKPEVPLIIPYFFSVKTLSCSS